MAKSTAKHSDLGNFTPIPSKTPQRLIWRSWGREKSGKNHFGLTAPGPIFGLYFDPGGLEGMAEKFLKAPLGPKEIVARQYRFNKKTNDQDEAIALKTQFLEDYAHALTVARTIQLDETELWELFRFAEYGRESARGREYGPLNGEYRGLIQDSYDAGVNLQLIQKVKEKWANDKPTGEMEPTGFKQAGNIVQVNLEHTWLPADDDNEEARFVTTIKECRQNMALCGESYENLDFATLGQVVYPESEPEDWE